MFVCHQRLLIILKMLFSSRNAHGCPSCLFLLLILFTLASTPSELAAKVNIEGISGELKDNVKVYISSIADTHVDNPERYRTLLEQSSREALQAVGYYEPVITVALETEEQSPSTLIKISAGKPVRVTELKVQLQGDAEHDPDFQRIMAKNPLRIGDPFHHGKYENLKSSLSDLATLRGYFDAEWLTAKAEISIKERSARVNLVFDTKQRYQFGAVTLIGAPDLKKIILATQNFKIGEPYSSAILAEYNANLNDSNYFRTILVRPDLDNRADGVVPIIIRATPYSRNIVSIGGGISTDIGLRGTLKWTVPRLNRAGHSLTSGIEVSTPEQNVIASYKIPIEDAHQNYFVLQTGFQRHDNADTNSQKYTFQAKRQRKLSNLWEQAYLVTIEYEEFRQGIQRDVSTLILPGVSFIRNRTRGGLNIHWGDTLQFFLEVSDPVWGSDVRLAKFRARNKWVRTSGERKQHKFLIRADLGAIAVDSIFNVPASMRFFTGGDQTIRGFNYESIAPRGPLGLLIGGKYLTVGSLEYDYLLFKKWRVATFIDAGTATNDFGEPISVGGGVGIRWVTPVGPLRLDLAYALSEPEKPWMIHFSMGPDI